MTKEQQKALLFQEFLKTSDRTIQKQIMAEIKKIEKEISKPKFGDVSKPTNKQKDLELYG
jgi:hypothetical protein